MGLCMSSGSVAPATALQPASTAMVLLPMGELREYPRPATAGQALDDLVAGDAGWFLCNADEMGFDGRVAAVPQAEELRPGQIYFVLPAEARRNGLRREDLAALAVSASAALVNKANTASSAGRRRRCAGSVAPLVFAPPQPQEAVAYNYKTVPAVAAKRRLVARAKSAGRIDAAKLRTRSQRHSRGRVNQHNGVPSVNWNGNGRTHPRASFRDRAICSEI